VSEVLGDAWDVYTLLFRRSVPTAAIVYAFVEGTLFLGRILASDAKQTLLTSALLPVWFAGPVLVQGALVSIVRDVHMGEVPRSTWALLGNAGARILSLVWASIVYGFGVFFGLLLLIVPGLLAASRWCLMAPLIMLEHQTAGDARARSSDLVRPFTWPVLGAVVVTFLLTTAITTAPGLVVNLRGSPLLEWLIRVALGSLTAPFYAHVLSVIYYRITDPENRVIHPDVRAWRSVWAGA
jgi:hypothetical protein